MELRDKLAILADAAKYDASCASSGAPGRKSDAYGGLGSTTGMGICHSYTPDGRCVSLLKILLTNFCVYDCQYCVNRRSSDVPRARFAVQEVVRLTLEFYRRNYIEGLFLSSGIVRSADYTMEQLVRVAKTLRLEHDYRGYIHLKTIPDADEALIAQAGRYADRLSVNIELPSEPSLQRLAPEKPMHTIKLAMGRIRRRKEEAESTFAPAGQSTQLIVGADASDDRTILNLAERCTAPIGSSGSTTPPTARSPARPRRCRRRRHRWRASTGSTRPTGCCATTAIPRASCCRRRAAAHSRSTSIPSLPGPCATATVSPWT